MLSEPDVQGFIRSLRESLEQSNDSDLFNTIVNAPFNDKIHAVKLDLGIVVLLLVNEKEDTIDRVALSNTELAQGAVNVSAKPFHDIKIPLHDVSNIITEAIMTNKPTKTDDWKYLFTPSLTEDEARMNQAGAGIGCSIVAPFKSKKRTGAVIFSFFQEPSRITPLHENFISSYIKEVELRLDV